RKVNAWPVSCCSAAPEGSLLSSRRPIRGLPRLATPDRREHQNNNTEKSRLTALCDSNQNGAWPLPDIDCEPRGEQKLQSSACPLVSCKTGPSHSEAENRPPLQAQHFSSR
ncbi:hypothetical protein JOQ06_017821, partial [Pogonophryne albipinna]